MKTLPLALALIAIMLPSTALAWTPLRKENEAVNEGNRQMAQGEYSSALRSYETAANELPESKAVQLNRGLALLAQDRIEAAKEALLVAADPSASTETRADAYYDLGVAYAREGDAQVEGEQGEQATASFREAADAFKRSLRLRPGDRDAAWNLEYAMHRIREQEQQQQEQQQDQQDSDEEPQDQDQDQDQENQDSEEQSQEDQDPQQDEQEGQEPSDQEQEPEQQDEEPEGQDPDEEREQPGQEAPPDQGEEPQQPQDPQGNDGETESQPMQRDDVQRFLDALEQNEESLPMQRARQRGAGRRPPDKDW